MSGLCPVLSGAAGRVQTAVKAKRENLSRRVQRTLVPAYRLVNNQFKLQWRIYMIFFIIKPRNETKGLH